MPTTEAVTTMARLGFLSRGRRDATRASVSVLPAPPPREVVVFSGGGSLGAAQVGAIQALFEAGIVPDAVVGCSVGALNAAYVAQNPTLERMISLEKLWRSITRREVFPGGRLTVARRLASRSSYVYRPDGMRALIERCFPLDDLAQTAIPCHVVATDLISGEPKWWTSGDPMEVLSASACIPGLFPPVRVDDRLYVDGGVSCPVPTQRALDLGAARVWVLNVSRQFHGMADDRMSALDVLLESFAISRSHLGRGTPTPGEGQRIVTLPPLTTGRHDMRDFSRTPRLIAAGREAGRAMVAAERRAVIRRSTPVEGPAVVSATASATDEAI